MVRKSLLILIVLLVLITPSDGMTLELYENEPGDDFPDITSLGLEGFRNRLKGHGQTENAPEGSGHTTTTTPVSVRQLIIINGNVIDGTGADPIPNGLVIIRGDRILAVGPRGYRVKAPGVLNVPFNG